MLPKYLNLSLLAGIAMLAVACSSQDAPNATDPVEIRLSASVMAVTYDGAGSRFEPLNESLAEGATVGVTVTNYYGEELYNETMTVGANGYLTGDPMYYPTDGYPLIITAITPVRDYTDLRLVMDQRGDGAFEFNNICRGSINVDSPTTNTIGIPLEHKLCKLALVINKSSSLADIDYVTINDIVYSVWKTKDSDMDIFECLLMDNADYGMPEILYFAPKEHPDYPNYYEAIVGPQTFEHEFAIHIILTDNTEYIYYYDGDAFMLRPGESKCIEITLYEDNPSSGPTAIDLGSDFTVLWASYNLGATSPEEVGDYYWWGDSNPARVGDVTERENWYTGMSTYWMLLDISGDYTNEYPNDDPATIQWGGGWRMPTMDEISELINNCQMDMSIVDNVTGYKFYTNDNEIYIPCGGFYKEADLVFWQEKAYLWSQTCYPPDRMAWCLCIEPGQSFGMGSAVDPMYAMPIRPVKDK